MYRAIWMEVGTKDGLLATNKTLEQTFTRFGVSHTYDEYDGDHTNKVFERIEMNMLPFFSKNLSFQSGQPAATHSQVEH
jgi:enterochelin esterase-like enzyme